MKPPHLPDTSMTVKRTTMQLQQPLTEVYESLASTSSRLATGS